MKWLLAHFERYRQRTPWSFCWRIAIESTVVGLVVVLALSLFLPLGERSLIEWPYGQIVLLTVFFAPVIETLLLQAIPIALARLARAGFQVQVLASMVPFAALHFLEGAAAGVGAGVIGGFYFAFTYAHWRERSRWTAIWTTTVCHGIHNAMAVSMMLPGMLLE